VNLFLPRIAVLAAAVAGGAAHAEPAAKASPKDATGVAPVSEKSVVPLRWDRLDPAAVDRAAARRAAEKKVPVFPAERP
jgi:hypothetical protein